jgi:Lrp/AsnC family transcriptional regulator, regulator for asnA, asnC and gidA
MEMEKKINIYIDELDFAILSLLQEDGRMSFTDIAKKLGIAVGTVRNRFARLIEDKTVQIIGRINPHTVGFNAPATISVSTEPQYMEEAIQEIVKFPEVSYLSVLTGEYDVMVDVMCRDANHLTEFLLKRLARVKGVRDFRTALILQIHKYAQPDLNLTSSADASDVQQQIIYR